MYESEDIKERFELTIVGGPNSVAKELKDAWNGIPENQR